jgi:ABC-type nickel/cobalt efflux system permease component RcnA
MNTLQIISTALSMISTVIMVVLAWVMIYRVNRTEVTFTGTPVDKKEFEKHQQENKEEHDRIFAKLGGVERGVEGRFNARLDAMLAEAKSDREKLHFRINPIEGEICALREASETNTTRLVQMEAKIDRLIERLNAKG